MVLPETKNCPFVSYFGVPTAIVVTGGVVSIWTKKLTETGELMCPALSVALKPVSYTHLTLPTILRV